MSRSARAKSQDTLLFVSTQLDLFPVTPVFELLDPKAVVGVRTGVEHLIRVRSRPSDTPHLVYHDRHGWYCEQHGPLCGAVNLAQQKVLA